MSVTAQSFTPELYTGNGSTTNFPVTFDYIASGDLVVNLIDTVTGGKTLQTLGVDYNVVNDEVVMDTAPSSTEKLHITRVTPSDQLLNLLNSHDFDAELVESGFDKLTFKDQEVAETFGRAIKFALTSVYSNFDFPDPVPLHLVRFNAAGDGLETIDVYSAGGLLVSAFMQNLLKDENALDARTNLDAQQASTILNALAGLSPSANQLAYFTGAAAMALTSLTAFMRTLLGSADALAARTNLDAQQLNAILTAISGLSPSADRLMYFTGAAAVALTSLTSFMRTLLGSVDAPAARSNLDAQQASTILNALAGLSPSANQLAYFTGAAAMALTTLTSFMRTVLGSADAAALVSNAGFLNLNNEWSKTQAMPSSALSISTGNVALDMSAGPLRTLSLTENAVLSAPTGLDKNYAVVVVVTNAGGFSYTQPAVYNFANHPFAVNTGINEVTQYLYWNVGSNVYARRIWSAN